VAELEHLDRRTLRSAPFDNVNSTRRVTVWRNGILYGFINIFVSIVFIVITHSLDSQILIEN
jgi:hypothetical protein